MYFALGSTPRQHCCRVAWCVYWHDKNTLLLMLLRRVFSEITIWVCAIVHLCCLQQALKICEALQEPILHKFSPSQKNLEHN